MGSGGERGSPLPAAPIVGARGAAHRLKRYWAELAFVLWLAVMAGATLSVWRYKMTPAHGGDVAPSLWPSELPLDRPTGRGLIIMLAHPRCTCTRASLSELAVLMTKLQSRASAYVLFTTPSDAEPGWEQTDTWQRAQSIRGVRVIRDRDGEFAQRLGATASGHVVAYDVQGHLVFSGGITPARGHAGDNQGRERLLAVLGGSARGASGAPTFGCQLLENPGTVGKIR